MANFTFKPKKSQVEDPTKIIPIMKKGFNLKGLIHRTQQWLLLGLLIYIAIKVS